MAIRFLLIFGGLLGVCQGMMAEVYSGTCGPNNNAVTWSLDTETGVMTISGSGEMKNWQFVNYRPWEEYKEYITSLHIGSNITAIAEYAFKDCTGLTSVTIPNSVTIIGENSFNGCTNLTTISMGNGLKSIRYGAFANCGLTSITIPTNVEQIWVSSFSGCTQLESVVWNSKYCTIYGNDNTPYQVFTSPFIDSQSNITSFTFGDEVQIIPNYLCHNLKELQTIHIPNSVKTIRKYAFYGCEKLHTLTFDSGLETIDESAFSSCKALQNVTFPNSLTSIGSYAFASCTTFTNITIPSSVTTIGSYAFQNCKSVTSLSLGTGLKSIQARAFNNCESLTQVTIPSNVTGIGTNPFSFCKSLTSITVENENSTYDSRNNCNAIIRTSSNALISGCQNTVIPDEVVAINDYAFAGATDLEEVHLSNNVTTIRNYAFYGCTKFQSFTIPTGVTSIGNYAFYGCSNLESFTIPTSVTSLGTYLFHSCTKLADVYVHWTEDIPPASQYIHSRNKSLVTLHIPCGTADLYTGYWNSKFTKDDGSVSGTCGATGHEDEVTWTLCDGVLTISGTGEMKDWNTLSDIPWYSQRPSIQHIVVEEGVTTLGKNAFRGCSNMTSVSLPSTLTDLGYQTFYNCSSLTSISIPEGITIMPASTFYECTSLTSISLPNTLERINDYAFKYCSSLTSLTIPNSVKYLLGRDILEYCSALKDVYVSWTSNVPQWNFYPYTSMNAADIKLHIPCGTASLYSTSTQWMWRSFFVLDDGSVSGTCGVTGNEANVNWTLSCDSILTISGTGAMADYTNTDNLPWVTHRDAIKTIIVEDGITAIGDRAFGYSTNATSVSLPSSVTSIGDYAFISCSSLQEITIPNTIDALGTHMLYACGSLTDIYVYWTENIPAWNNMTNKSPQSNITLHVPCGTKDLYKAENGWKSYTIVEDMPNIKSGTYGPDNIEWSFDYCDSTLSITGNGELRCDNNNWGPNAGGINPNLVKRVFVGKGVTYLGIYTLSYMSNIEYIEVEDGHPTHRTGCNAIIRIGTEQEGDTLIFGCPHTVIPTTCTTIRGYAFWDDHLVTEMTIPSSVRQIANMQGSLWQGNNGNVFYTSNNTGEGLKDLYVEWTKLEDIPEVLNNKLGDMTKVRLHVPCGTTALYKQVTGWKNFKEYIEEATSYTVTVQAEDPTMGDVSIIVN